MEMNSYQRFVLACDLAFQLLSSLFDYVHYLFSTHLYFEAIDFIS